jgi:hypothetical protein
VPKGVDLAFSDEVVMCHSTDEVLVAEVDRGAT